MIKLLFSIICTVLMFDVCFAQSLIIPAKEKYIIKDTAKVLILDSLVLNKKSSLIIPNQKDFTIQAKYIILEDKTSISAHDGENNGTNLKISGKFLEIGRSVIDVSGHTFLIGKDKFPNGNGGDLLITYHEGGLKPQVDEHKSKNYIEVLTRGASTSISPWNEINNIWYRINLGSGIGRSPAGLPNGKVYDATTGEDGKVDISPIN